MKLTIKIAKSRIENDCISIQNDGLNPYPKKSLVLITPFIALVDPLDDEFDDDKHIAMLYCYTIKNKNEYNGAKHDASKVVTLFLLTFRCLAWITEDYWQIEDIVEALRFLYKANSKFNPNRSWMFKDKD